MKPNYAELSRIAGAVLAVAAATLSSPSFAGSVDKTSCSFKGK